MMWHTGDGWGWWMLFGWVWMILFWGLIVWAVIAVTSRLTGDRRPERGARSDALVILEERYARGEITAQQFDEMRGHILNRGVS